MRQGGGYLNIIIEARQVGPAQRCRSPIGGTKRCSFLEADIGSQVQHIDRMDGGYADKPDLSPDIGL